MATETDGEEEKPLITREGEHSEWKSGNSSVASSPARTQSTQPGAVRDSFEKCLEKRAALKRERNWQREKESPGVHSTWSEADKVGC